jgi:hypothetical protein
LNQKSEKSVVKRATSLPLQLLEEQENTTSTHGWKSLTKAEKKEKRGGYPDA